MNTTVHASIRLKLIEKVTVVRSSIDLSLPIYAPSYSKKETRALKPGFYNLYAKLVQQLPNYLVLKVPAYSACHFRKPRYDVKIIDTIPADSEIYKGGQEEELVSYIENISHPGHPKLDDTLTDNLWLFSEQKEGDIEIKVRGKELIGLLFGTLQEFHLIVRDDRNRSYFVTLSSKSELKVLAKLTCSIPEVVEKLHTVLTNQVMQLELRDSEENTVKTIEEDKRLLFFNDETLSTSQQIRRAAMYLAMRPNGASSDPAASLIADFIVKKGSFPIRNDIKSLAEYLASSPTRNIKRIKHKGADIKIKDRNQAFKRMERTLIKNLLISLPVSSS